MPISYTYNTVFIHIPKCGGTTIEKILGTCTPKELFDYGHRLDKSLDKSLQHLTYLELKENLKINWVDFYSFSVVRNPYSRAVSEYKYQKDLYLKTSEEKYNHASFENFLNILNLEPSQRIGLYDGHMETQMSFLKTEEGTRYHLAEIFNFENLAPCWERLENITGVKYGNYLWSRKSKDPTPYQDFYALETQDIVYNFYKEDFENFGYSKDL